jgi:hypothetical protein
MNLYQIKRLAWQACWDSVIEIECPVCGTQVSMESDNEDIYCDACKKVTGKNPLKELGII